MKEVIVPEDIVLMNLATGKPLTDQDGKSNVRPFKDFAFDIWLNDPKVGNKPLDYAMWGKVVDKFVAITGPGYRLRFEDAEYAKIITIVRDPTAAIHPLYAVQFLSFPQAMEDAKTVVDTKSAQPSQEVAPPTA